MLPETVAVSVDSPGRARPCMPKEVSRGEEEEKVGEFKKT